ncbi:hypothetical protein L226DRAFT_112873 [Lentinus tigrinus ALCF2SS1-7]|uniref:uncharacterized protein n=1 Tax=Lentinus tigrinus ALCF2SS1-7 TaxID=1328758 RepID=UPI001166322D|nr:hypothetical protein L226DRAFT_112873 [Lentinus tigrinus ALCF2SS1-7]
MAQPLFDQHPLEEYFRHTGETAEPMPGGSPDFVWEEEVLDDDDAEHPSSSRSSQENNFAERFKYDVISSSLLSSSLAAPTSAVRRTFSPDIPGKLDDGGGDDPPSDSRFPEAVSSPLGSQLPVALISLAVVILSTGYFFIAMIPLFAAIYVRYVMQADADKANSTTQTLEALNELISAGNVWDSAINEAIMLIENEERSIFYGPTTSQAPSSGLRVALQSSLFTTQTQCDNVRQLLAALTDPTSLTQLAEMYAPPSPVRPVLSLDSRSPVSPSGTLRPFSHPSNTWRQRTISLPSSSSPTNKRATWNGSYAALAVAGSPTAHLLNRKKQNRHSNVISLFQATSPGTSVSAPVSPQPPSPLGALEEEEGDRIAEELETKGYFGAAALDMQRKRKSQGLESFGIPPPSYTATPPRSPMRGGFGGPQPMQSTPPPSLLAPTIASSSRLTSVHTTRHPLSLSGLHLALQGALASKRYSCSHLLALRFSEDEDDAYWENVRSVMALLSSTFSDASMRLVEALDEAEKRRVKDEAPTPPRGNSPSPQGKEGRKERCSSPLRRGYAPMRSMAEMISYAPMPTNMSRLAGHIDAISSALNDARDHMEECISSLRNPSELDGAPASVQDHPAFQAYDRLRKELGFALRECERGRERLLDIIAPRPILEAEDEDADASPHTPGLRHDSGSDTSENEKGPVSPVPPGAGLGLTLSFGREDQEHEVDDATAHLLLNTSSQHLPPPGVEQVFETETDSGAPFTRPRSKLTREERIKIMKARRVSGLPTSSSSLAEIDGMAEVVERPKSGRWGPEGEVVQELKDVIWKVGEKRRKMSEQVQQPAFPQSHLQPQSQQQEEHEAELTPRPHPVPVPAPVHAPEPVRETSILIDVDAGSPVCGSIAEEDGSELAYLDDSPSPPSKSLPGDVSARSSLNLELEVALAREQLGAASSDNLRTTHELDSDSDMS